MDTHAGFVEEIDIKELELYEVVGRGAFGVVSRGKWRNQDVAVKLIETDAEKKAFKTELKQLSRVCHPNIVLLYGACTSAEQPGPVCLVMEYAEGGSLYNVLHGQGPEIPYTAAHALSWTLQCSRGVEYLHGMKPKPLVHRDLKPPNLLLIAGGTKLKICDFGTACDAHTHMTNNKGSAAWMAPEVFEGSNYSEKCDVFSWGIILWEVISRKKPFDDLGGPAFRIMWAVHNGTRPPLIAGCPKPLETLMTNCWAKNPVERPSMCEVVRVMEILFKHFDGADVPLSYPQTPDSEGNVPYTLNQFNSSVYDTPPHTNPLLGTGQTVRDAWNDTMREGWGMPMVQPVQKAPAPKVVEVKDNVSDAHRRTSAPASLAASRESLLEGKGSRSSTPSIDFANKRYSADLSKLEEMEILSHAGATAGMSKPYVKGHRRTGSHGTPYTGQIQHPPSGKFDKFLSKAVGLINTAVDNAAKSFRGHRRTGSYGNTPIVTSTDFLPPPKVTMAPPIIPPPSSAQDYPPQGSYGLPSRMYSWTPGLPVPSQQRPIADPMPGMVNKVMDLNLLAMDHQLQPLAPITTCTDSMAIYKEHVGLAHHYLRVQAEIALLTQRKQELTDEVQQSEQDYQKSSRFMEEYQQLLNENDSLQKFHDNLKKQVELVRQQQGRRFGEGV